MFMKTKIIITFASFSLVTNLFAQEITLLNQDSPYKNLREGKSQYLDAESSSQVRSYYQNSNEMRKLVAIISNEAINSCASSVIDKISKDLSIYNDGERKNAILALRLNESIDDVATSILLKANNKDYVNHSIKIRKLTSAQETKAIGVFKKLKKEIKNTELCPDDTYRLIVSNLYKEDKDLIERLKIINSEARDQGVISSKEFKRFEELRINKVYEWPLTLAEYKKSLSSINKMASDRKPERSNLVTDTKVIKGKYSLRQVLYQKFDSTQIYILANMLKNFNKRLEAKDVSVHIEYHEDPTEIISLSPMETFRFILKLLRKELAELNNSSILKGQPASYLEIITAAYEVGYISEKDIEAFANLEEIWNPKTTTKQKVMFWVKFFGGIGAIFMANPISFLSVMVIMLIDQQLQEPKVNADADFNLM